MRPSQYTDSDCPTCPDRMKAAELPADFKVPRAASVLRHSVTESIRNAILVGRFQPGERLPQPELGEMTGVSRPLAREALRSEDRRVGTGGDSPCKCRG